MPLELMNSSGPPLNSIAVALLAIAVIVLAIKEPRCNCESDVPAAETPATPQAPPARPSKTGRQRELRKF
jgi:hypothetical protein